MRGFRTWLWVGLHWPLIPGCRLSSYLPWNSRPSSKVEGVTSLGHAAHVHARRSGEFRLWRDSQYNCEYTSCGPGRRSGASSTCIYPTQTITPFKIRHIYTNQGNHVHNNPWYPSYSNYRSSPHISLPVLWGYTHLPRDPSPTACM